MKLLGQNAKDSIKQKGFKHFLAKKTWRAVCSRDLAIKPWTEAECVVDLILVCAVKVSGKFVLYNRAILSSMAPPAHCNDVTCYWVQHSTQNTIPHQSSHHSTQSTSPEDLQRARVLCVSPALYISWEVKTVKHDGQLGLTLPGFHQEFLREDGE